MLQLAHDGLCAGTVCACSGMSALGALPTLWCERSQGPVDSEQKLRGERSISVIRNELFWAADTGNRSRGNEEFQVDGEAVFHWNLNCKAWAILVQNWCPKIIGVGNWSGTSFFSAHQKEYRILPVCMKSKEEEENTAFHASREQKS